MATEAQIKAWVAASPRDWNQKCQALMYQVCLNLGTAPVVYSSAAAARAASTIVGTNPADALPGDFHQFDIGTYDHVALSLGGSRCLMGSAHVAEKWGVNAGVTTVEAYCRATGARYLGFSRSNGRNDVTIDAPPPVVLAPNQRRVANTNARLRAAPSTASAQIGLLTAGTVQTVESWRNGDPVGSVRPWFKIGAGYASASLFVDSGTHDLPQLADWPEPVVVPEPEPPVVEPEPEPEPVEPTPVDPAPTDPEPEEPAEPSIPTPVDPVPETPAEPTPKPVTSWVAAAIAAVIVVVSAVWLFLTGGSPQ